MSKIIYLIGARAAGKTTIGGLLARKLGLEFADTDISLKENAGLNVAQIVAAEGWPGFRKRESEILRSVVSKPNTVVATGGGMVLAEENRDFMRSTGLVLFLAAPPEVLAARLAVTTEDSQRPSLTGRSITEEMAEIVRERTPLYNAAAHHRLDASKSIEDVLAQALEAIK
ncbi:MAG: shikimate kinase AroL [Deltaproteobacteria bacterium]|jgi:shikimate kinase|nr:shikimate kinase AroL [Deltaproteobacteria bacterium]